MSPSNKPWLAGRQPSDRGGVPQVRTWLDLLRQVQQARVLLAKTPNPTRVRASGAPIPDQRHTRTARPGRYEETLT